MQSRPIYIYAVTINSPQSAGTIWRLVAFLELARYSGATRRLERVDVLGERPVFTLILKIPVPNGGAVIRARNMLLLMNFEEQSTLLTSSDGWTVIQSQWRPREVPRVW